MTRKSIVLCFRFYKKKLSPWLKLSSVGLQVLVCLGNNQQVMLRWHSALAKIDRVAILQTFYDFVDELPWWFYG